MKKKFTVDIGFGIININGPNRFASTSLNQKAQLKKKLYYTGPMVVSIWGDSKNVALNKKRSGKDLFTIISQPSFDTTKKPDHDVLLVGYATIQNTNYWILQNSWGEKWGHGGFFGIKIDHRPVSEYFNYWTSIDGIEKKQDINFDQNIPEWTANLDISKFIISDGGSYKNNKNKGKTETGFLSLPEQDSILDTYYNTLKTFSNFQNLPPIPNPFKTVMCWATPINPVHQSIVTRTETQGMCGSCWLFAGMSMIQSGISNYSIKHHKRTYNVSLSRQYVCQNMFKLPSIKDRMVGDHCCEGGNTQILEMIVNGYKGLLMNRTGVDHDGTGLIPTALCKYDCYNYMKGDRNCDKRGCKDAPTFKSTGRKYKEPEIKEPQFIKNLKKFWEDNKVYIIIGMVLLLFLVIYFSFKK